jgi:uncharacterized protein with HEPN domain
MFDQELVRIILCRVDEALEKIKHRFSGIDSPAYFFDTPEGEERLDGICMLFIACGESLKNIDKITSNVFLAKYPDVDWTGIKGFSDVIAHQYFDVDAEQVFWICRHNLYSLSSTVKKMIHDLS